MSLELILYDVSVSLVFLYFVTRSMFKEHVFKEALLCVAV